MRLVASGSVDDYTPAVSDALREKVAAEVGVNPSLVTVRIVSASVAISFLISLPEGQTTTTPAQVADTLGSTFRDAATASTFFADVHSPDPISVAEVTTPTITDLGVAGGPPLPPPSRLPSETAGASKWMRA